MKLFEVVVRFAALSFAFVKNIYELVYSLNKSYGLSDGSNRKKIIAVNIKIVSYIANIIFYKSNLLLRVKIKL